MHWDIIIPKQSLVFLLGVVVLLEIHQKHFRKWHNPFSNFNWKHSLHILLASLAAAGIVLFFDMELIRSIRDFDSDFKVNAAEFGRFFGRSHGTWGVLAALYMLGYLFKNRTLSHTALFAIVSSCITGLIAHLLKFIFLRARPYKDLGAFNFFDLHGFMEHDRGFQSFPSGDVAISAGAMIYLFTRIKQPILRVIFLIIPFLTALSRVNLNRHWPSDTLFSIGLGFAIAIIVHHFADANQKKELTV